MTVLSSISWKLNPNHHRDTISHPLGKRSQFITGKQLSDTWDQITKQGDNTQKDLLLLDFSSFLRDFMYPRDKYLLKSYSAYRNPATGKKKVNLY